MLIKSLIASLVASVIQANQCPQTEQVKCVDDFRAAYPVCEKAAQAGGSDTAADLQCMKYYSKVKTECWPCICMIAQAQHLNVKGC